jgi:hypothetical protein
LSARFACAEQIIARGRETLVFSPSRSVANRGKIEKNLPLGTTG